MSKRNLAIVVLLFSSSLSFSQSKIYKQQKVAKIANGSVFTKIIDKKLPATILYEDKDVIAFLPLRLQAKVHVLIVPKREIPTINDINENDAMLLGKLFLVAKKLAKEQGIAQTGYRLTMNMNEDLSLIHI